MDGTPLAHAYRAATEETRQRLRRPSRGALHSLVITALAATAAIALYHFPAPLLAAADGIGITATPTQASFAALCTAVAAASLLIGDARDVFRGRLNPHDYTAMIVISLVVNITLAVAGVAGLAFLVDDLATVVGHTASLVAALVFTVAPLCTAVFDAKDLANHARHGAIEACNRYWIDEVALVEDEIATALETAGIDRRAGFRGLHQMAERAATTHQVEK